MKTLSASAITLSLLLLSDAQAQPAPPPNEPAITAVTAESNVFTTSEVPLMPAEPSDYALVAFGGGSQFMQQMRKRLEDPAQRAILRAEQRSDLLRFHADVGRVLGIDAATESALIELLTEHRMEQLDSLHLRREETTGPGERIVHIEAARHTRRIEQLRELLGEPRLEQYQSFEKTFGERAQIRRLNARLDPAHKLTSEQTEKLVPVYRAHNEHAIREQGATMYSQLALLRTFQTMTSPEQLQRHTQLQNIALSEDLWRRMPDTDRSLRDRAAAVLTAPQLAMLAQLQSEQAKQSQLRIEQLRVQAGLAAQIPAIPDVPLDAVPPRTQRDGDVRLSLRLSIDRSKPMIFSQVVRNGAAATFDVGDGLSVDATPTLYDDGLFELNLAYYEQGSSGRRLIGEGGQSGSLSDQQINVDLEHSGGSATVIVGRKAYAVESNMRVEAL